MRHGPGLVGTGRFSLILGVSRFSLKGPKWFRLWVGMIKFQYGALANDGIWYKDRVGLRYKWQVRIL